MISALEEVASCLKDKGLLVLSIFLMDLPKPSFSLIWSEGRSQCTTSNITKLGFPISNPAPIPITGVISRIEYFLQLRTLILFDCMVASAHFFERNPQISWNNSYRTEFYQILFIQDGNTLVKYNSKFLDYFGQVNF
jgi:hypothetical protein